MRVWGGGVGTFWRLQNVIGVEWTPMPDWGSENMPGVRSRSWALAKEEYAERWFELLTFHRELEYHRS